MKWLKKAAKKQFAEYLFYTIAVAIILVTIILAFR